MRIGYSKRTTLIMAGVAALCLSLHQVSAEIVFQADFSGPGNSRNGAPYDCVTIGGFLAQLSGNAYTTTTIILGDNPMTADGGYLSVAINTNFISAPGNLNTVKFTPNSAASSLDAMTSVSNGQRVLNGGFDFFFRPSRTVVAQELRALDMDNKGKGGLRIIFASSPAGGLILEILSNANGLFAGGEGGSGSASLNTSGIFSMLSNTICHVGVTFATEATGTVKAKIWGQAGTNAIDLTTATPVATLTFGINEAVVTNGFSTGDFDFNQIQYANVKTPMTMGFDQFRIYNAPPAYFGALETPATAAWEPSAPEIVLQADFNGAGNSTGGKDNLITLGGTGVLANAGTSSTVSVIETQTFKEFSKGYLSVLTTTNNPPDHLGGRIQIAPASAVNSLATMTVETNGQRVLKGGFDLFFRSDKNIDYFSTGEFRPIDSDNRTAGGLRVALYSATATTMALEIIAPKDSLGLFFGGEGGTPVTSFIKSFSMQLASNTLYHVGVSFSGDAAGNITAAIWLKQGTGPIDLRLEIPVSAVTFGIDESKVTSGFSSGVIDFGKLRQSGGTPSRQDFDTLRIYKDTPILFAELPSVAPMGTVIGIH